MIRAWLESSPPTAAASGWGSIGGEAAAVATGDGSHAGCAATAFRFGLHPVRGGVGSAAWSLAELA
ncbi:hypothetical protein ABZ904_41805 [Streptomyces sp. NPDC046900]|uniref:hypothetical protein n=1 Tax=Streptomyces sp. NPDC046900 TaxID=3155473 RepID=UPI0034020454